MNGSRKTVTNRQTDREREELGQLRQYRPSFSACRLLTSLSSSVCLCAEPVISARKVDKFSARVVNSISCQRHLSQREELRQLRQYRPSFSACRLLMSLSSSVCLCAEPVISARRVDKFSVRVVNSISCRTFASS